MRRFLHRAASVVDRVSGQALDPWHYRLDDRADAMAAGEQVVLADVALYNIDDYGAQLCTLVLTQSRLVYSSELEPLRFGTDEFISSIPIPDITEVSYRKGTLLDYLMEPKRPSSFVILTTKGVTIHFRVRDAKDWCARVEHSSTYLD